MRHMICLLIVFPSPIANSLALQGRVNWGSFSRDKQASSGSGGVGSGRVSFSLLSLGLRDLTSQLGRCAVQLCHVKAGVPAGRLYLCGH